MSYDSQCFGVSEPGNIETMQVNYLQVAYGSYVLLILAKYSIRTWKNPIWKSEEKWGSAIMIFATSIYTFLNWMSTFNFFPHFFVMGISPFGWQENIIFVENKIWMALLVGFLTLCLRLCNLENLLSQLTVPLKFCIA